jgi:hypothetical protein
MSIRVDEVEVPVRLGDSPSILPLRKPFDLTPWQFVGALITVVATISADGLFPWLPDVPMQPGTLLTPLMIARVAMLFCGFALVLIHPRGRSIHTWAWVSLVHFWRTTSAVYRANDDVRGATYFPADAKQMTHMQLDGESTIFVVNPPMWGFFKRTPMAEDYWRRHVPYRMLLPVEPEGSLELMTDDDRSARGSSLSSGLRALTNPVQIVAQARPEDVEWVVRHAIPPIGSPFASLRPAIARWARERAKTMMQRRVIVACSAAQEHILIEHVRDVHGALRDGGLVVREITAEDQLALFDQVYGKREFYPHSRDSFGIDKDDWVTIVVRHFPRHVVIGWIMYVIGALPVDVALYSTPDDAVWLTKIMEWFQGMCDLPFADTAHHDALADLQRIEGRIKRNEDSIHRVTLLLTMPKEHVARISNRLRKAGAVFRLATAEHEQGRWATLPVGGVPRVGATRPLNGEAVAACYPFGSSGLRMRNGAVLGVARDSPEVVTLDVLDLALLASMIAILGTTGSGKTFLMQLLTARSGLPFTLIDMKPHVDEDHYGDFYRFTLAANGQYDVVTAAMLEEGLPAPHPTAQCYNLAMLSSADRATALYQIAEQEWARALDSLVDRIFGVDESYILGQTDAGKEFIERVATQGRSVGFIGLFASQMVGDYLRDARLQKAVKMSSMVFVLAQEHSEVDVVVDNLAMGEAVRTELRKFQPSPGDTEAEHDRYAILRVGRRLVSFKIEACPEEITLFTTRPRDKRAMRDEKRDAKQLAGVA